MRLKRSTQTRKSDRIILSLDTRPFVAMFTAEYIFICI